MTATGASPTGGLSGRRVVITRARAQAGELVRLLAAEGAEVLECPTIRFEDPADWGPADRAIDGLADYDWVVFTSANGLRCFLGRLQRRGLDGTALADARVAAIGPATAGELGRRGVHVDLTPPEFVAESLIEAMAAAGGAAPGARVLIPRAEVAREVLPQALSAAGASVDVVAVYRTVCEGRPPDAVLAALEARAVDAVTFTSASTATRFAELMRPVRVADLLDDVTVACIGPVTAEAVRGLGLDRVLVPERSTVPDLVRALVRHLGPAAQAAHPPEAL